MSPEVEALLEQMRDNPGAISPYAAAGAAGAALNEITRHRHAQAEIIRLRHMIRQMRGLANQGADSPMAAHRWCERIDEVGANGPMAEYDEYSWGWDK